jgi:hypothetical protein
MEAYNTAAASREDVLESFMIQHWLPLFDVGAYPCLYWNICSTICCWENNIWTHLTYTSEYKIEEFIDHFFSRWRKNDNLCRHPICAGLYFKESILILFPPTCAKLLEKCRLFWRPFQHRVFLPSVAFSFLMHCDFTKYRLIIHMVPLGCLHVRQMLQQKAKYVFQWKRGTREETETRWLSKSRFASTFSIHHPSSSSG